METTDLNPENAILLTSPPKDWNRVDFLQQHVPQPFTAIVTFLCGGYDTWVPVLVSVMDTFGGFSLMWRVLIVWGLIRSLRVVGWILRNSPKKSRKYSFYSLTIFSILVGLGLFTSFVFSGLEWYRAAPVIRKVVKQASANSDEDDEEEE